MKIKYYYLHGLGGSRHSTKFTELQKEYKNIECLEWEVTADCQYISNLIISWQNQILVLYEQYDVVCIIANSTGANFALQLKELLKPNFIHLVLINPLLDLVCLFDKSIMPKILLPSIIKTKKFNSVLILIAKNDSVIDNINFLNHTQFIKNNNHIIIDSISTHKYESMHKYYKEIESYIHGV